MINRIVGALTILALQPTAYAQVTVDVSKITCEQMERVRDPDTLAAWLSGYYHGERRNSLVDMEQFKDNTQKLKATCRLAGNFKRPIMELIDGMTPGGPNGK